MSASSQPITPGGSSPEFLTPCADARTSREDIEELRCGLERITTGDLAVKLGGSHEPTLVHQLDALAVRLRNEQRSRERQETARRHLLAAVSHDLRTPITSLRLLADALEDNLVDAADRREYTRRIGTHVRQLSALIDDLFVLARLEAREIRWTLESFPLGELVIETVDAMQPEAAACSVSLSVELPTTVPVARANPEQLQRVLFNLVGK